MLMSSRAAIALFATFGVLPALSHTHGQGSCPTQWDTLASMPHNRSDFAVAEAGGKFFVVGGTINDRNDPWNSNGFTDRVDIYDATSNAWSQGPTFPVRIRSSVGAGLDGIVYVFGGETYGGGHTSAVWYLDTTVGVWNAMPTPMLERRSNFHAEVVNGLVYIFTGFDTTACEIYNPQNGGATNSLASAPYSRSGFDCVLVGTEIWIVGGLLNHGSPVLDVWRFDTMTAQWLPDAPKLPGGHNGCSTSYLNGEILVMGGTDVQGAATDTVDRYDSSAQTWLSCLPLMDARFGHEQVSFGGEAYLLGGEPRATDPPEQRTSSSTVEIYLSVHPRALKLTSLGNHVTAYISPPTAENVANLDGLSVEVSAVNGNPISPIGVDLWDLQDQDEDGSLDTLMLKFDRTRLAAEMTPGLNSVYVSGLFFDGRSFGGSDTIRALQ